MTRLPKVGNTSPTAVGRRLAYGRQCLTINVAEAARLADATPEKWSAWEAGVGGIQARNLWLFSVRVYGPTCWLMSGDEIEQEVPSPLPRLGDDLTGFASRLRQQREKLGISLDDIRLAEGDTYIPADRWQLWENAVDEPEYSLLSLIARHFEVDLKWLYTDSKRPVKAVRKRKLPMLADANRIWMPGNYDGVGKRLKQARERAKLTVDEVARILGFAQAWISELETEAKFVGSGDGDNFAIFASLYGVQSDWLSYGDDGLAILNRRLERFRRQLLGPRRGKRKAG